MSHEKNNSQTIVASATPVGRGGVAIIRISGPQVPHIAQNILKKLPAPRTASFSFFYNDKNEMIDEGLALFFPAPHSFTGEDILELHGHGSPVVQDLLLKRVLQLGARLAQPGEFSKKAFLNNKIDLTQAEAIADLIDAASEQAAKSAVRSLQGAFSDSVQALLAQIIELRMYVEAAIDFPEEEIDFLSDGSIAGRLESLLKQIATVQQSAKQGVLLREGMTVVITGKTNAGKSSLLNALSGKEIAIVTEAPGTTRDVLREHIHIDGIPLHIVDTAGLRESEDPVEQEGIRRALIEISQADAIVLVVDATIKTEKETLQALWPHQATTLPLAEKTIIVRNKVDLLNEEPGVQTQESIIISLSAKEQQGIHLLKEQLKKQAGWRQAEEGIFISRRRHLDALQRTQQCLQTAKEQLKKRAGELLAEELRLAQQTLGEITGEFHSDELLGKIFTSFCIGK